MDEFDEVLRGLESAIPDEVADDFTLADASGELRGWESLAARIDVRRARLMGWMVELQTQIDVERWKVENGTRIEPSASAVAGLRAGARASLVDTMTAVCGGFRGAWLDRARLGTAPESLAKTLQPAVAGGALNVFQAATLLKESEELDITAEQQSAMVESVVEHARGHRERRGVPVSQPLFRSRVRKAALEHAGPVKQKKAAHERRRVKMLGLDDGQAGLEVRGAQPRVEAAMARLDAVARSAKAAGDARTLAQLRADAALDLLIFGAPAPDAATSIDHPGEGGWPPAVVNVVVSAASLLGANEVPGLVEGAWVDAQTVRELAHARGSVWQRIVADPVTGYAMDAAVDSYRPTAEMARVVRARDGHCRAPGCLRPAAHAQLDHVRERRDGGPTKGTNLQDLCTGHHPPKSRRHWSARMDDTGVVTWRLADGTITRTYPMDYRDFGIHQVDHAVPDCPVAG
ncbi:HNH endonuclease signature motif containing protein [Kineosphaera limosa]|uniref:HNH endonuclease signature motif containing protein n=1 Tax=Kineosphaera limosa TaxID=111564 RepID=UPI0020D12457|nr:HNH endonuclease signature motif containing protein [Kineosphaera limosa]